MISEEITSKIALGTVQIGLNYGVANTRGQISDSEVERILILARSRGVDTLDTAVAYGQSESALGHAGVSGFKVVTKLPQVPESVSDIQGWISAQAEGSLQRMGIGGLYGLLLHAPSQLLQSKGRDIYRGLQDLKKQGVVEKIGYSIYSPTELTDLYARFKPDLIQAPLNIFDQRMISSGWLSKMASEGVEFHARSVFLQGLLLMERERMGHYFHGWNELWNDWDRWVQDNGISRLTACLSFVTAISEVGRLVVGVDAEVQLKEILDIIPLSLDNRSLDRFSVEDERLINPSQWNK